MLICTECNKEYEKGKFCMECGARLSAETSAAPEITYEELKKLYDEGQYEESYAWAKKLADRGDARGQNLLGIHYRNGKCVEQKAVYWFRKAAEQGLAPAQCNLGRCYMFGRGVREDKEKAFYWWQKVAEQGDADAQYWLGRCYYDGDGVEEDKEKAVFWYQKAAEQGHEDAWERLWELGY